MNVFNTNAARAAPRRKLDLSGHSYRTLTAFVMQFSEKRQFTVAKTAI